MNIIETVNATQFELNGIKYLKNFLCKPIGNKLTVFNCYDNKEVLIDPTIYTEFSLDGTTFPNVAALQEALLEVLYSRTGLNEGTFPDATTTTKGKLRLGGDFDPSSTADNPLIKPATPTQPGKTKMYTSTGQNTDGGMTQKAVTDSLSASQNRTPKVVFCDVEPSATYTGSVNTEHILKAVPFAASDLEDGIFNVNVFMDKNIVAAATFNVYLSSTPTNISVNKIASFISAQGSYTQPIYRRFRIRQGRLFGTSSGVISANYDVGGAGVPLDIEIPVATTLYIIVTVTLQNTSSVAKLNWMEGLLTRKTA